MTAGRIKTGASAAKAKKSSKNDHMSALLSAGHVRIAPALSLVICTLATAFAASAQAPGGFYDPYYPQGSAAGTTTTYPTTTGTTYGNTGNTGYGNTGSAGYGNTGYGNTGYGNTGYGNTGNNGGNSLLNQAPPGTVNTTGGSGYTGGITSGGGQYQDPYGGYTGTQTFNPTNADAYGLSKQGKFVIFPKNNPWNTGASSQTTNANPTGAANATNSPLSTYQTPLTAPLTTVTNTYASAPPASGGFNSSNFVNSNTNNAASGSQLQSNSGYTNNNTGAGAGAGGGQYGSGSQYGNGTNSLTNTINGLTGSTRSNPFGVGTSAANRGTTGNTANNATSAATSAASKAAKLAAKASSQLTQVQNYTQAAQTAMQKALNSTSNTVQTAAAAEARAAAAAATAAASQLQSLATSSASNAALTSGTTNIQSMAQQAQSLANQAQSYAQQATAKAQSTSL